MARPPREEGHARERLQWARVAARYGLAVGLSALALLARAVLLPQVQYQMPYATFFVAVVLTAFVAGPGPTIVAIVLGWLGAGGILHGPQPVVAWTAGTDLARLGAYLAVCAVVLVGSARISRARDRAEASRAGLEREIAERRRTEEALRRSEAALREADRRKDEFLGVLSHELRNPLAPIRNSVHVLGHADPASEQAGRARAIIARQVEHLSRLVDDLLDVKRISTGKLRLHAAAMDLVQQVRETVEDLRPLFVNRALSLELGAPQAPVWVHGDRTRVAQMLTNLLHNAAKFTNAGGHVAVVVEAGAGQVAIRVRDDGVGVPPEILGRLFDAFVQSERTLHRTRGGLGLGLALVRGIAELHGGTVAAHSEGDGKGTEFVITLPTSGPGVAANEVALPRPSVRSRVLIIEDNADAAESLRDVVELLGGHQVLVATDGEAGLSAARSYAPDVILCDIGLPAMDGYEVARRVRAGGVAPAARLVALSGYASADDVDRALRAGFDYHLAKPPDVEQVLALVADAPGCAVPPVPKGVETGHHELDAQHAAMLAHVARIRTASRDSLCESLKYLRQHVATHLGYEETLMEDVGYPDLAAHRERHEDFRRQVRVLQERLEREGATPDNVAVLTDAVEAWVAEHVLEQDRRLAEFIRSRAVEPQGGAAGATVRPPERPQLRRA